MDSNPFHYTEVPNMTVIDRIFSDCTQGQKRIKREVAPATATLNHGGESFSKTVASLEPTVHCCKKT